MMIRLEIPEGPNGEVTPHTYMQAWLTLGTDEDNHVVLSAEGITAFHAAIEIEDQQGALFPGKENGVVRINGTPIEEPTLLQPGDIIQLGTLEIPYKLVPFPRPEPKRVISKLEWATLGCLLAGVLGQVFFLTIPSCSLRREIEPHRLIPTPTPIPTPTAVPIPTSVPDSDPPGPGTTRPVPPTPTPAPRVENLRTPAELTKRAQELIQEEEFQKAATRLRKALQLDAAYLPAKVELARLLAIMERYEDSIRMWEMIRDEAPAGSNESMDARFELPSLRRRLEQQKRDAELPEFRDIESFSTPEPIKPEPGFPENPSVMLQEEPLRVENIRMERYADSPRYDEFRILSFDLKHNPGTPAVEAGKVKVRVTFFEQMGAQVRQADIPVPRIVLPIQQQLTRDDVVKDLRAAYEVPPGKAADGRSYYGAVMEVFIDGKEVHRVSDPSFLLDFIR